MSSIPAGLARFQKAIPARFGGKRCIFCDAVIQQGVDFAVIDNGTWANVCAFHAGNVVEQCKARIVQIQAEAAGLNEAQMAAVDAHCPANLEQVLLGEASHADTIATAGALDSAVRVIRMFHAQSAPAAPAPVRSNRYPGKCGTCGKKVAEEAGRIEKNDAGKWITFHLDGQCPADEPVVLAADGLDLTPLKAYTSGGICRFGIPGVDTRLKVAIRFKRNGDVYVDDAAVYGHGQFYGRQLVGEAYRGKIESELRAILADPHAAVVKYAALTDRCGVCNTHLEDETSIARGMGPVCAAKFG